VGDPERFGEYLIREPLGTGGMAEVHLAEHVAKNGTRRVVALKRLRAAAAANRELREWFMREAKLTRYLDHPNITATYANGNYRGTYYIAMEHVPGPTLRLLIEQVARTVTTLPVPITLNIASQICEALDHAHTRTDARGRQLHIVHRDICPANTILRTDGVVKVIDFGLAKVHGVGEDTDHGKVKGKFNYIAPEYLDGTIDARADLWALGVVMYELLTSRRLFDAPDNFETINRVRKLPIPRPSRANPTVSPELDDIVMTALERDPGRRWQTAAMLRDALDGRMVQRGDPASNEHVAEWVRWVYELKPGTEASGMAQLRKITQPVAAMQDEPPKRVVPESRFVRLKRKLFGSK
jgi:serine/threonine protein kinase